MPHFIKTTPGISLDSQISLLPFGFSPSIDIVWANTSFMGVFVIRLSVLPGHEMTHKRRAQTIDAIEWKPKGIKAKKSIRGPLWVIIFRGGP